MKKSNNIKKIIFSAFFLALAYVLPFFTGQIRQIGNMLCPMHIPVLLCGFICGAPWGFAVGVTAPVLRSIILGMPDLFPTAICMALELGTYGGIAGFLHKKFPKRNISVYFSLILAMISGRIVWGAAMFISMYIMGAQFGLKAFIATAVINAIPGILLQLILVPILVNAISKETVEIL